MAVTTALKAVAEAVADRLGQFVDAIVESASDAKTFVIPRLKDVAPGDSAMQDWFLYQPNDAVEWHRISSYSGSTGVAISCQDFTNPFIPTEACQAYGILNPDEWRGCANEALETLFYEDIIEVALVAEQDLYDLSTNTWLQMKGQILDYKWYDVSSGVANIYRASAPVVIAIEEENAVKLYLPVMPIDVTNITLHVVVRHYYAALATDAATTKCPYKLLKAEATWRALEKIYHKMGTMAKSRYGRDMVLVSQERDRAREVYVQAESARDPHLDDPWEGVNFGEEIAWPW